MRHLIQRQDSDGEGGAGASWWTRLRLRSSPAETPPPVREVWSQAYREYYRTVTGFEPIPFGLARAARFCHRLQREFERAVRQSRPLAVVVFQLPDLGAAAPRQWQDLEIALRRDIRREDIPARLTARVAALCLPHTGEGAWCVAARLERVLARQIGGLVTSGVAYYPLDGPTALDLLRFATWRSLMAAPGQPLDPELQELIGPMSPPAEYYTTGHR